MFYLHLLKNISMFFPFQSVIANLPTYQPDDLRKLLQLLFYEHTYIMLFPSAQKRNVFVAII